MKSLLFAAATLLLCAAASRAALTPDQLTPQERATYDRLASSSPNQLPHFLATREYVRICQATTRATAAQLPDIPKDYDATFVTLAEQNAVDHALDMSFAAMLNSAGASAEMGEAGSKTAPAAMSEDAEFVKAIELVLAGKTDEGVKALVEFNSRHPKSQSLEKVSQALEKAKGTIAAPAHQMYGTKR